MKEHEIAVVTADAIVAEMITEALRATGGLTLSGTWRRLDIGYDDWIARRPDVAVVDRDLLGFDPMGSVEAIRDSLGVCVLIRVFRPTAEYAHLMLTAGAGGIVCTTASCRETVEAVMSVAQGRPAVPDDLLNQVQERLLRGEALSYRALSARERRVAGYIAAGATAKETADRLVITEATVRKHLNRVYEKLGVRGRAGLVPALAQLGVLDLERLEAAAERAS